MKKVLCIAACLFCFSYVNAFRIEYGGNIIISQPVMEDLYIAGGNITINAPVMGDLIVAGGTIIINDTITNDILLAGGTVIFNGYVGDDIRCAGGNIRISKNVGGDVVISGGSINIDKGVTIGGLMTSGGDVTIDGNVNGEIKGVFGKFILNGNVAKNADCRGGSIVINGTIEGKSVLAAKYISIGNNGLFKNEVRYWNKKGSIDFKQSLMNSKATFDPSLNIRSGEWYFLGATTLGILLWYLGMALVMLLIIQYLFSATLNKAADNVFNNSLKSLGTGFLFLIAVPVLAVIAIITLVGLPVGFILLFGYIGLVLLATIITSLVAANWMNNRNKKNWNYGRLVLIAFAIFILLKLISLTPFVGWVIMILLVAIAFGGILLTISFKRKGTIAISN